MTPLTYPNALLVVLVFLTGAASGALALFWFFRWTMRVLGGNAEVWLGFLIGQVPDMRNAVALWARQNLVKACPPDEPGDAEPLL